MFETGLQRNLALNLRIYSIILFILPPNYVCKLAKTEIDARSCRHNCPIYSEAKWAFAPLGKAASEIVDIFFVDSSSQAIKSTTESGVKSYKKFVYGVISYIFMNRVFAIIVVVFSSLVALLLLLMPYFIGLYRSRQLTLMIEKQADGSWKECRNRAWLIFECIGTSLFISFCGAALMALSVSHFEDNIHLFFNFSVSAFNTSCIIKGAIQNTYYYGLTDLSNSVQKCLNSMNKISFFANNDFMKLVGLRIDTIDYLWRSVLDNVRSAQNDLNSDQKKFEYLLSSTNETIVNNTQNYRSTLNALKSIFDQESAQKIFGPVIDPLLNFPDYSLPNITPAIYDYSLQKLENLSKLDILTRSDNLRISIRNITDVSNYDPYSVKSQLSRIGTDTVFAIRSRIEEFVAYLEFIFRDVDGNATINEMRKIQKEALKHYYSIFSFILIFSIVSASLSLFFFLMYSLGVWGTEGFREIPPGVTFVKSSLSHLSGQIIIFLTYFTVIFLAFFWAFSTFLFLLSSVPSQLCSSANSGSLFIATIDHPSVRNAYKWFNLFSSKQFNTTLTGTILKCDKNLSYFSPLDGFKVNKTLFDNVKPFVNTSNIRAEVESTIQNFSYINIFESDKTAFNFEGILDIDVHPLFESILEFFSHLSNTNNVEVLTIIKNHPSSSDNLIRATSKALKTYETFTDQLTSILIKENTLNSTIKFSMQMLESAKLDFDGFIISAESLETFMKSNASDKYISILNSEIYKGIDDCFQKINSSVEMFRNSLSFCPELLYHYHFLLYVVCERVFYPVSLCWLGSSLVNIFFLLSVILCVYSVTSFIIPPEDTTPDIPQTVRAEDLPSTSEVRQDMAHILLSDPSANTHSTGKKSITASESSPNASSLEYDVSLKNKEFPLAVNRKLVSINSLSNFKEVTEDSNSDEDHEKIKTEKRTPSMKSESSGDSSEGETERNPVVDEESSEGISKSLERAGAHKKTVTFKEEKSVDEASREKTQNNSS